MSVRIAHLSDLHLGFRAYPGVERGWNRRERDVAGAFQRALQVAARLRPDLVLITGDLFHRPDPPSTAFLSLVRGVRGFQSLLPGVPILAIGGERDTPRSTADPGPVAVLDSLAGVEAAAGAARAVRYRSRGVHALLVPHRALREPPLPEVQPDREARYNVLLLRGSPEGGGPGVEVDPSQWDYVAVGGPHRARIFQNHVRAAGSLERIGWDPWSEGTEEKGFFVFDLDGKEGAFHPVPTRPVVDLAPVRCDPGDPARGTRRLRHLLDSLPGGIDRRLVRVRLEGDIQLPEEGVEAGLLEGVRRRAAHLEVRLAAPASGTGRRAREKERGAAAVRESEAGLPPSPEPGLHFLLAESPGALARGVEAFAALAPDPREQGLRPELLRVLRVGGPPDRLLEAAQELLSPQEGETGAYANGDEPPRRRDGEAAADLLEAELVTRRADAIEAEGEVEAGAFEWARDRQEAETRLQAQRDRAHELRDRLRALEEEGAPCPTCGRSLEEGRDRLRAALQEEWETVVQDGKWWKRRRDQLDERPEGLVELEGRARTLRAEVSRLAEELDRRRDSGAGGTGADPSGDAAESARPFPPSDPSNAPGDQPPPALGPLLAQAGSHLRYWTEGILWGLRLAGGGAPYVVERGGARDPTPEELRSISLLLHLALREEWDRSGASAGGFLVLSGLDDRGVDPLLPLLTRSLADGAAIVVALPPTAPLPGIPGSRGIRILEEEGGRALRFEAVAAGPGAVRWSEAPLVADAAQSRSR